MSTGKSDESCVPPCSGGRTAPTGLLLLPLQPVGVPATYVSQPRDTILFLEHQCLPTWCHGQLRAERGITVYFRVSSVYLRLRAMLSQTHPTPTIPSEFYSIVVHVFRQTRKKWQFKERRHSNSYTNGQYPPPPSHTYNEVNAATTMACSVSINCQSVTEWNSNVTWSLYEMSQLWLPFRRTRTLSFKYLKMSQLLNTAKKNLEKFERNVWSTHTHTHVCVCVCVCGLS